MECAILRNVSFLEYALFGMCFFWNVLKKECAQNGMCSKLNALFLECDLWNVLCLEIYLIKLDRTKIKNSKIGSTIDLSMSTEQQER